MEFPDTGKRCSIEDCQQLDFLPFVCEHCQITFCKEHYHINSHKCTKVDDNTTCAKTKSTSFVCSETTCQETSPVELQCNVCKKHFCVQHRHHECSEMSANEKTKQLKKWQIPKKQFAEAKAIVDQQISDNLKKSKNTTMANKIRLMRVKGFSVGPKTVPMDDRRYFLVYPPTSITNNHIGPSKGIYVNVNWTIGKAIDTMADTLKLSNNNNAPSARKLQLFHYSTGQLVCDEMDTALTKLLENLDLIDGQEVILEYSDHTSVDTSLYK